MSRSVRALSARLLGAGLALAAPLAAHGAAQSGNPNEAAHIMPSQSQGLFTTLAWGVVESGSGTGHAGELLVGDPGAQTEPPKIWLESRFGVSGADHPEYTTTAMFGPSLAGRIRFAGISTGNDFIPPVLPSGRLDFVSILRWFSLTVTVTNDAVGEPGSHPRRLNNMGDTPGGELFTYYFSMSNGLPPAMVNTVQSERSRETQGFPSSTLPGFEGVDISGLDYGLGVIPNDLAGNAATLFHQRDRFYFALTAESVGFLGGEPFAEDRDQTPPVMVPANTETIYGIDWLPTAPGSPTTHAWGVPYIEYSPQELELDAAQDPTVHEIDAIAVDNAHQRLIFSTKRIPGESRNQLFVSQREKYWVETETGGYWIVQIPVPPLPLRDGNGILVTEQVGAIETDDVNGTCGFDPEMLNGRPSKGVGIAIDTSAGGNDLETPVGPHTTLGGAPLGLSLTRTVTPSRDEIVVTTSGLAKGSSGFGGRLLVYYKDINPVPGFSAQWFLANQSVVSPGQQTSTFVIPGPSVSLGLDIGLQAVFVPYSLVVPGTGWGGFLTPAPRLSWVSTLAL